MTQELIEMCKASQTEDVVTMRTLLGKGNRLVKLALATNKHVPTKLLDEMAKSKDTELLELIAQNNNTSKELLSRLSDDQSDEMKVYVAKNTNTDPEILRKLSANGSYAVKKAVQGNPNVPEDVLESLNAELSMSENDFFANAFIDLLVAEYIPVETTKQEV